MGGATPFLVQLGLEGEGARSLPWLPLPLSTKAHEAHYTPRGVPVTPRYSGIRPNLLGVLPMSKHSHPIYQSLCLDHFETPRYVRDHIRDSYYRSSPNVKVCGPYEFENYVDMTATCLQPITNSGTWMLILAPTYSTKIEGVLD